MKLAQLAFAVLTFLGSVSLARAEALVASFLQPDGGVTSGLYSGIVHVTVSGIGQSRGQDWNDAFYLFDNSNFGHDPQYYQLSFGTSELVGYTPAQDAVNFLVGALPAYNPTHIYSFDLNTGTSTPTQLHFGVSDGIFSDNFGAYRIEISSAVPEPATWALMIAGFLGIGFVAARRRTRMIPASC